MKLPKSVKQEGNKLIMPDPIRFKLNSSEVETSDKGTMGTLTALKEERGRI